MSANRYCQRCYKLTNMHYISKINKQRLCYICHVNETENRELRNEKHEYRQKDWSVEKDNLS